MSMIALQTELSTLLTERAKITGKIIALYEKIRAEQEEAKTRIPDYSAYLSSDVWKAKSRAAKERAGYRCGLCYCKDTELHTHHRTYERLGMENDADLIVLCCVCHAKFHNVTA